MSGLARLVGPTLPPVPFATFNDALDDAADTSLGLTFVDARERERFLTFRTLHANACRVAAGLRASGVMPGERVALVLPTGVDFVEAFFGVLRAGAVPVPLYPPVRLGRMDEYVQTTARMLSVSGSRLLVTEPKTRLLLGRAVAAAKPALWCVVVDDLRGNESEAGVAVGADALALVQFSSGTTVEPKPVALTHRQVLAQCAALKALLPAPEGREICGVSWLPLYHDMGLIGCLLSAVFQPGRLVLLSPEAFLSRPSLWLRAIARHRATVSPAPDFAYALCVKRIRDEELEGVDLSGWTYALDGAEPVSSEGLRRFAARFERWGFRADSLMPVYGLSEASLAVAFPRRGAVRRVHADASRLAAEGRVVEGARALVSVGSAVPGVELEVRDESGGLVKEREVGRVHVRAPFVMSGYLDQPEATASALQDGWLDTGDVGFVDAGELFLCGRARDLVIIRGANHAPQTFEECLVGAPGVRAGCAVAVGYVAESGEEALLLLVETTPHATPQLAQVLTTLVAARTGVRPHRVELLAPGTLPRTSSGKLRRGEALRRFQAGLLTPPAPTHALAMTGELARSVLALARNHLG